MKYTLLELTQAVLSSLDGDEVNSINDTVESQQVVKIIKRCYGNIAESSDFPDLYGIFHLTASGDSSLPAVMYFPTDTAKTLQTLAYDCRLAGETDANYREIVYVEPLEFGRRIQGLRPSEDATLTIMTIDDVPFLARNNAGPSYYTSIADDVLVFDAYDSAVDTTLQSSKTTCYGELVYPWSEADSYIIPIGDHQLLLNESIALAWAEMKQAVNAKAEREIRNQKVTIQRKKQAINPANNFQTQTPNYGRR